MFVQRIIGIFRNEKAVPFLSFLIGFGIAIMLFHRPIPAKNTLSVSVGDIEGKTVPFNKKCYTYHAEDAQCELPSFK
jgi:hypothetical protein